MGVLSRAQEGKDLYLPLKLWMQQDDQSILALGGPDLGLRGPQRMRRKGLEGNVEMYECRQGSVSKKHVPGGIVGNSKDPPSPYQHSHSEFIYIVFLFL